MKLILNELYRLVSYGFYFTDFDVSNFLNVQDKFILLTK